jgi:predicted 3-demethylubiquinone-9 3-methyltransferase (glyoxalase superfamily)
MAQVRPFFWFDDQAEEAARFYAEVFADVADVSVELGPMPRIRIGDIELLLFNGGPHFTFSPAISLFVEVAAQDELDQIWDHFIANGGTEGQCGWLTDRFGISWQIVPKALGQLLSDPDPIRASAVHAAMMSMIKLDITELERAADAS